MFLSRFLAFTVLLAALPGGAFAQGLAGIALVRHAPALNSGTVEGSVHLLLPESVTLNGGAVITSDLLVPGTPGVRLNGKPHYAGTVDAGGSAAPSHHQITLNGAARLRHVIRRSDPLALPTVPAPLTPTGTRAVTINNAHESVGDFGTLRDLTLNGNVGQFSVPPGNYGTLVANSGSGFTLGLAGATQPVVYHVQRLDLNGQSQIQVLGPVILNVAYGFAGNGRIGHAGRPEWLALNLYSGGLTLNGGCTVHAFVTAPSGAIIINGHAELIGGLAADRLTVNGGGVVRLVAGAIVNRAPVAQAITASVHEDDSVLITLTASDADGDPLVFQIAAPPAQGALGLVTPVSLQSATVRYTPAPNATGSETFTYRASDGRLDSNLAAVTIEITPQNDPPVARNQTVNGAEDTPVNVILSGTDADGDVLTFAVSSVPSRGTLSGTGANRIYTPDPDFHGADAFTYTASDGIVTSAPATVTVNVAPVNDAPIAHAASYSVNEGATVSLALSGFDVEGDALTFERLTTPANGILTGTGASFTYRPNGNFSGLDSFTFRVSDGQLWSAVATIQIHVTDLNFAPVANHLAATTDEDTAIRLTLTATDQDGHGLTYFVVDAPAHGTLGLVTPGPDQTGLIVYTPNEHFFGLDQFTFKVRDVESADSNLATVTLQVRAVNDAPVASSQAVRIDEDVVAVIVLSGSDVENQPLTFSVVTAPIHGTLSVIERVDGRTASVSYTPAPDFHGTDSFTFRANDGFADSAPAFVSVLVAPINDAPVAQLQTQITAEDQPLTLILTAVDADHDSLTFTIDTPPRYGSLGAIAPSGMNTATVIYTPALDFHGEDTFTFRAHDGAAASGAALVSLRVQAINDAPVAVSQTLVQPQDTWFDFTLEATDVDGDGLTFSYTPPERGIVSGTAPNLRYTPVPNDTGTVSLTFTASDGLVVSAPATITLTMMPVSYPPVAAEASPIALLEDTPVTITLRAEDQNGDPLTFHVVEPPSRGTLGVIHPLSATSATIVYTPSADVHGADSFTFKARDAALDSNLVTVALTIQPVNDAPVASAQSITTPEDVPVAFVLTATDADGDPLTFALVTPPAKGSVAINPQTGAVTFTPQLNAHGPDSFTWLARDPALAESAIATVSLVLVPVNDAPVAAAQHLVLSAGTPHAITLTGSDVDGDSLTYAVVTATAHGTLTGAPPALTYTPNPDFHGADAFTFKVRDPAGAESEAATITLTVNPPPNRPPVFGAAPPGVLELPDDRSGPGLLRGTVRDFSKHHPNFERPQNQTSVQITTGVVAKWLGNDGKPVPAQLGGTSGTDTPENFNQWYRDVPGVNFTRPIELPVSETAPGSGVYAFRSDAFFPVDNEFYGSEGLTDGLAPHNFNFTCEFHSQFVYEPGQTIMFGGDDSIWVFIDNRLVIDLGGVHVSVEETRSLDELGLVPGRVYPIDIFYAEQHTGGASLRFRTNFGFELNRPYSATAHATDPDGDVVTYTLLQAPAGMTIDAQTGALAWTAGRPEVGTHQVTMQARDTGGLAATQTFSLEVQLNRAPVITVPQAFLYGSVGLPVVLGVSVADDGKPAGGFLAVNWSKLSGPGEVVFSDIASGAGSALFSAPGQYVLRIHATDGSRQAEKFVEVRIDQPTSLRRHPALVSWWPGNRTPADVVGQHDATLYYNAGYSAGVVGDAFIFDGLDDVARVPATPDLNIGAASAGFSIDFWLRPDSSVNEGVVLGWTSKKEDLGLSISIDHRLGPRLSVTLPTAAQSLNFILEGMWAPAEWTHIAVTYDRAQGRLRIYRNGVIRGEQTVGQIVPRTTDDLAWGDASGNSFRGAMDELAIYRAPLTPEEVSAIYTAGASGRQPPDGNEVPSVDAGPDIIARDPSAPIALAGSVSDDGSPTGSSLSSNWSVLDGPGPVDFATPYAASTTASFGAPGNYLLQLVADDGAAVTRDTALVRVGVVAVQAPADLIAWWPVNGNPGEAVSGIHDLQLISGPGYVAGHVSQGMRFDGVASHAFVPAHADLDPGASPRGMSLEVWVKAEGTGRITFAEWRSGNQPAVIVGTSRFFAEERLAAKFFEANGSGRTLQTRTGPLRVGVWEHIVLTYDKVTGEAYFYRNGLIQEAETVNLGIFSPRTNQDLRIGVPTASNSAAAVLDEMSLYARALEAAEVQALYAAGMGGKNPPGQNLPPAVAAGPDLILPGVDATALLQGVVTDDQQPFGPPTITWEKVAGPGTVTFSEPSSPQSSATFGATGTYLLALTATDHFTPPVSDRVEVRVGARPLTTLAGTSAWFPFNGSLVEALNGSTRFEGSNGAAFGDGRTAQALTFNGVNQAARARAHASLDVGAAPAGFTVEFWLKPEAPVRSGAPVVCWQSPSQRSIEIVLSGSGTADMAIVDTTGVSRQISGPALPGREGQWLHLAYTYDRTSGWARTFLNGSLVQEKSFGTGWTVRTDMDVWLGALAERRTFAGALDELTFYGRPLAIGEIRGIYEAGHEGKIPSDVNTAPVVAAGPDVAIRGVGDAAGLSGSVWDDHRPFGAPSVYWKKLDGSGAAAFAAVGQPSTSVTFSEPGTYLLQLDASDGFAPTAFDVAEVRVNAASAPSAEGMAAWWPFNQQAHDAIAGSLAFEFGNGARYAAGRVMRGLAFDGVDDFARTPRQPQHDIGNSSLGFTIEFWVQGQSYLQHETPLLAWHEAGAPRGVEVALANRFGARWADLWFFDAQGSWQKFDGPMMSGREGEWVHLAYTLDRTTGIVRSFANARLISEARVPANWPARTNLDLHLAARTDGPRFHGMLDEVSLYRRPLGFDEIAAIYRAGADGKLNASENQAPTVDAGPDINAANLALPLALGGTVTDDAKPFGPPTVQWMKVDGPGAATFEPRSSPTTNVTLSEPGFYLLELTATDHLAAPVSDFVEVHAADASIVRPAGLIAWWTANGHARDAVGGHDLQVFNPAPSTKGKVLRAWSFDGATRAYVSGHPSLDLGQLADGFTVECWVRVDTINSDQTFLCWAREGVQGLRIGTTSVSGNTVFEFALVDTTGTERRIWAGGVGQHLGQWVHLAATVAAQTREARLYLNGALATSQALGTGWVPNTALDVWMGSRPNNQKFVGALDEVSLYNRPLAAAEIAAIHGSGSDGKRLPPPNAAPVASAGADRIVPLLEPVYLAGTASDDGLPDPPAALTFLWSKVSGPGVLEFSDPTALTTQARFATVGSYILRLTASDSERATSDDSTFTVVSPPQVALTAPRNNAALPADTPFTVTATAHDQDGSIASVAFFAGGIKLGEVAQPPYAIDVSGLSAGSYVLTASATALSGLTSVSTPITVQVIADPGVPFAELASPAADARITAPQALTGVVTSPLLDRWSVQFRLKAAEGQDPEAWRTATAGNAGVGARDAATGTLTTGALGAFDPTLLINGIYEVRLTATDTAGRTVMDGPYPVLVEGNMKVGAFTVAFEDLKVPAAGIPISVTRVYDSRDPRPGDFGPGWRLALNSVRVQKNRHLGAAWWQTPQAGSGIQFYDVLPQRDRIVSVVLPDGETHRFRAGALVRNREGDPDYRSFAVVVREGRYRFYPIGETTSKLEPVNAANAVDDHFYIAGTGEQDLSRDAFGFEPFNPTRFRLTLAEGTVLILDEALGLLETRDLHGNTLALLRDDTNRIARIAAVQNTIGGPISREIVIARDGAGRVDYIRDLAGRDLDYVYDDAGRLSAFADREGNITQFQYETAAFPHYLTRIIDPRGICALRSEFDAAGRMIKQIDAEGKETTFARGIEASGRFERIKDRLGHETTFYYDDRGNVTSKIDPLGAQTTYAYWPDSDRVKFETDHYGNVKAFAYDAAGNVTVETLGADVNGDPVAPVTGFVTRTLYNAQSAPTLMTDPDGRVQQFTYDPLSGALLTHTVGAGGAEAATSTFTYFSDGSLKTSTDAVGNVTTYTYDHAFSASAYPGAVKQTTVTITDSPGAAGSDPSNLTGTVLRVTRTVFDIQENPLAEIATRTLPSGTSEEVVTRHRYDHESRLVATVLADGRVNETRYTAFGTVEKQLLWKSVADFEGGAEGEARATSYGYDARGNQTSTTHPDGSIERTGFDAENRKVWSQDARGYRTHFVYDALGRLRYTIHPDNNDGTGGSAPDSVSDPRLADNPRSETIHDLIGRVRFQIDEAGATTEFTYDDNGGGAMRRKETIQHRSAGNLVTRYTYDNAGHVRFVTDPRGSTVENRYDSHGRLSQTIFPATDEHPSTHTETRYDLLGRRTELRDQEGRPTRFRYDGLGRLIEVRQYLDASTAGADASFTLASTHAQVISTRYRYDELGNQTAQIDGLGRMTTYATDTLGRRTERTLPKESGEAASLTERLVYDAWGALEKRTDFAGRTTTFTHDVLGRLIRKAADPTHPSLGYSHARARVEYDYDSGGARIAARTFNANDVKLSEEEAPRDARARVSYKDAAGTRLDYTYYANGQLRDVVSSNAGGVNVGYRYDEANRLEHVDDVSIGLPARTTSYAYTPNGSVESVTQPNGVVHAYSYDPLNRLRGLNVARLAAQGGSAVHAYTYALRASGHRRQVTEGVKTTAYTYDELYRLTGESVAGATVGGNGDVTYVLDKVGNRLARTSQLPAVGSQVNLTYNARDWRNGDSYTANGSTTTGHLAPSAPGLSPETSGTDVYDFEERLILRTRPDATTINVRYDADGHRIAKTILSNAGQLVSSTTWVVDTNNLTGYAQVFEERVVHGSGAAVNTTTRVFTYGSDLISMGTAVDGGTVELRYYAYDGHGSTRELTDAAGEVTDRYTYDAFGVLTARTGTTANAYLYCGEQYDADLGLYYLRARYLNAESGRFWSMDAFEGFSGDPGSLHKYTYAGANPVSGRDPSGYMTLTEVAFTSAVVGITANLAVPVLRRAGFHATADFAEALGKVGIGLSMLAAAPATAAAHPFLGTYLASRGVDYMANGLYSLFTGQAGVGTWGAELVHELTGIDMHWAEMAADLPLLAAAVAQLGTAVGPALQARAIDVFQRLKRLLNASARPSTTYQNWNQFQTGTRGQFASRGEAAIAWRVYKEANDIVIGSTRNIAARTEYLRSIADHPNTASWMKPWLHNGRVPPGYSVDHIKPLSIGGADLPANMRLQSTELHRIHHQFYDPWNW